MTKAKQLLEIVESSMSRIFDHIEKDRSFGIISAFRAEVNKFQLTRKAYQELLKGDKLPIEFVKKLLSIRGKLFNNQDEFKKAIKKASGQAIPAEYEDILYAISKDEKQINNEQRHKELKAEVKKYGFIEMQGGFKESTGFVNEKSLFIPVIPKRVLLDLGEKYKQCSVIFKDDTLFAEIGTGGWTGNEPRCGKGQIITKFKQRAGRDNLSFNIEIIKEFFSKLLKGPRLYRLPEQARKLLGKAKRVPKDIIDKLEPLENRSFQKQSEIEKAIKDVIGSDAWNKYKDDIMELADAKKFVFQLEESSQTPRTFYAYHYKSEADIPFKLIYEGYAYF